MSTSSKSKVVNIFTLLVLALTAFQGLIPTMPLSNPATLTLVSAIVMFLVSALTAWKQALSVEIDNAGIWPTLIVAIVATIGGLNDLFQVIPFGQNTSQWVRFGITFLTMIINLASKVIWPTAETKSNV
jgi:hypothetical protein